MHEFLLPDVGEGIHEAELLEWLVVVGAHVEDGEPVAVVNTDKVTVELPSPVSGVVTATPWDVGDVLQVGQVLMTFDTGTGASAAGPVSTEQDGRANVPSRHETPSAPTASAPMAAALGRPIAAPSTRKLAAELGVDLFLIAGSGPGGRILRHDVERSIADDREVARPTVDRPVESDALVTREPLTGVRAVIWQHMATSSTDLATTTSTFTVRTEAVEALIHEVGRRTDTERKIGVLAATSMCVVQALTRHPRFNATVDPDNHDLLMHRNVHLGVAVASPNGLTVPVVRDAETLRLSALHDAIADRAAMARTGALGVGDLRGGTFTISSTGGIERARVLSTQPIVNLPQVALLWMSRIRDEPVVEAGNIVAGRVMSCSLSFDHRYIDGEDATRFINEITEMIEHPLVAMS
jgi:pyruvate/2-oxoglutarate dehydrogenase complex dihydrolipoamide acyltransferase (E2) component